MSNTARVEEVSDSDPEIDDPSSFLPTNSSTIISPANIPSGIGSDSDDDVSGATTIPPTSASLLSRQAQLQALHSSPNNPTAAAAQQDMLRPQPGGGRNAASDRAARDAIKTFHSLYPVYFDASRTRAEGRRVACGLAVANPLAREIADAVSSIVGALPGVRIAFEPDKLHPKDWANPGRVRIQLRSKETGAWLAGSRIKNKSHLYILVAEYLQKHPTTKDMPLRLKIAGMPVPDKIEPPAVPKGWKVNEILPLHSPAMSGGGVSDNMFRDMMAQMQAEGGGPQLPPGMAGALGGGVSGPGGGGETKKKKDKKKGKA